MEDELRLIAKIQHYYDMLCFKKVDIEQLALSTINGERKSALDKLSITKELIQEFDNIFKEFLYKERL